MDCLLFSVTYEKQKDPESAIEADIEDDTSGDFKRLLISACQGNRRLIEREKLFEAVEAVEANGQWSGMFRVSSNQHILLSASLIMYTTLR